MANNIQTTSDTGAILEHIEMGGNAASGPRGAVKLSSSTERVSSETASVNHRAKSSRSIVVILLAVIAVTFLAAVIVIAIYFSGSLGKTVTPSLKCDVTKWACLDNLTCIDFGSRCDGKADCPVNGEDEQGCKVQCRDYHFDCGNGACVALHFECNGRPDCTNGADEAGCSHEGPPCLSTHFTCSDGTCIPHHQRCNYFRECPDDSDELPTVCGTCNSENEFECDIGNCIPEYWQCDFYPDCAGGEDEMHCPVIHGSELIELNLGQAVNISSPHWPLPYEPGQYHLWNITAPNSSVLLLHFLDYSIAFQSLLTIFGGHDISDDSSTLKLFSHTDAPDVVRSHTNLVSVQFHAGAYVGTRGFLLEVTALKNDDPRLPNCNADFFFCHLEGECVPASQVCDGNVNCVNGTDESGCSSTTPSLTDDGCNAITEYECMRESSEAARCIPKTDRCNYFLDCPLFDDETNCVCQDDDFRCNSGQCIPSYFVCDYYYDCLHGNEDEVNCATPNNTYSYMLSGTSNITIRSPNYPSDYPPRAYQVYYVTAPEGHLPVVVFDDFLIDWKGFLSFGTGNDVTDHAVIFAVFDHHEDPTTVSVTTRAFFIEFHGGPYGRSRGFQLTVSAFPSDST